jgi:hypothetical protein
MLKLVIVCPVTRLSGLIVRFVIATSRTYTLTAEAARAHLVFDNDKDDKKVEAPIDDLYKNLSIKIIQVSNYCKVLKIRSLSYVIDSFALAVSPHARDYRQI